MDHAAKERTLFPALDCCQGPLENTKMGGVESGKCRPLPVAHTFTRRRPQTEGERESGRQRAGQLGTFGIGLGGELGQVSRPASCRPLALPLGDAAASPSPARHHRIAAQARFRHQPGQGSQGRRQSHGVRRQADGPTLASWPSALPGGGGLKARLHHWLVQRGGLHPFRAGSGASAVFSNR